MLKKRKISSVRNICLKIPLDFVQKGQEKV